jgi:hypothetical protein
MKNGDSSADVTPRSFGTPEISPRQASNTPFRSAVPTNEFLAMVFKRYPFVLSLRERYLPISKEPSFALLPHFSTTEAEHALRREDILNLIHQWLHARGFVKTANQLCFDSDLEAWDLGLGPDLLLHLLQAAAPPGASVFETAPGYYFFFFLRKEKK